MLLNTIVGKRKESESKSFIDKKSICNLCPGLCIYLIVMDWKVCSISKCFFIDRLLYCGLEKEIGKYLLSSFCLTLLSPYFLQKSEIVLYTEFIAFHYCRLWLTETWQVISQWSFIFLLLLSINNKTTLICPQNFCYFIPILTLHIWMFFPSLSHSHSHSHTFHI